MNRPKIAETAKKRTLLSDGAWGTFLQEKGLKPGECPELWCIDNPRAVLEIAQSYIAAGAEMIETNSFGASSYKLKHYNLQDRTEEINHAAAALSRQAAGEEKWVIASVGPTGKMILMGDITEKELYNSFKVQSIALSNGGADAICIETMSAIDEATQAIRAAKENTNCEIICTFTFEKTSKGEYRTMMGVTPIQAAEAMFRAGADIIGTNCGNGICGMIHIVKEMRQVTTEIPIIVQANADARNIDNKTIFPETPAEMGRQAQSLIDAGANIIGGCCGTTPDHIRAIKRMIR